MGLFVCGIASNFNDYYFMIISFSMLTNSRKCDTNQEVGKLEIVTSIGKPTETNNFCRASWSPDGKFIAVPTISSNLIIF